MILPGIALAGAVGAPCRYLLDRFVHSRTRHRSRVPWGTIAVNVSGSLALGLITGAVLYHAFPATPRLILGTGFCGAYTTFSTFTVETVRLLEEGALGDALVNVALSTLAGTGAAALGLAVMAIR